MPKKPMPIEMPWRLGCPTNACSAFFTAVHFVPPPATESLIDVTSAERETLVAARRAGADLVITHGVDAAEA